ncbi:PAS domain-containing protein [Pontiella agarivorans]|uniref:PAS domain-containing protein n=1 Tax=Pontiella agarivorans TaxID=3038953 RepID=A0ABU5N0E8_9BACT|nr:PAS domain-containing protein [Pontiella agarivorans]MDZ8119934.1 PAS domain-containing protein [Pontiella agarivorans]
MFSILLFPRTGLAQQVDALIIPLQMNIISYLFIGVLLIIAVTMFLLFQRRYKTTKRELDGLTEELTVTRTRLTESNEKLEAEINSHKATNSRFTDILFEAGTGMFQLDHSGKCIYINQALQEMSGLYPQKALKEGIHSAVHPEDKDEFIEAWQLFAEQDETDFEHRFRFRHSRDRISHVVCRGRRVRNVRKDVESYIFWVTDITPFQERVQDSEAEARRMANFMLSSSAGFYRLVPESPVSMGSNPDRIAEKIMKTMVLGDCNQTFAGLYGVTPDQLMGKTIGEMKDGCGLFRSLDVLREFARNNFRAVNIESVHLDANGTRVNLVHEVKGIVEAGKLVGIWGMQRDISSRKRELAERNSRIRFLQRIIDSLPADVQVKDTRCQYLYASKKLAERTGISQEEWVGKTIYEIMPGAPRDYDVLAIKAMKTGTLQRCERQFNAQGQKGWMENNQIPLVSKDGLVEGVISLSFSITDHKNREEDALNERMNMETRLVNTQNELADEKEQNARHSTELAELQSRLDTFETSRASREQEFEHMLAETRKVEESLRRSEQGLLTRQQQLEEQLSKRLNDLNTETDKRKKWEELLQIKEDELRKIEENLAEIKEHYTQETARREDSENQLRSMQTQLSKLRGQLAEIEEQHERELEKLNAQHQTGLEAEQSGRKKAENQLSRTREFLESTQEQVKRMTEQHTQELEEEVTERKAAANKLLNSMNELESLRKEFGQRLEEETRAIKQELAQKQIREKAMRKHEKDQEKRIKELERTLNQNSKDYAEQLQAREGAESEKNEIEQKMEQLSQQQQKLMNQEREKMNLTIADIRLGEVKIRRKANELEAEKARLEEQIHVRDDSLEKARRQQQKLEAELNEAQAEVQQLSGSRSKMVASETSALRKQLEKMEKAAQDMKVKIEGLMVEKNELGKNLETRNSELKKAAREYRKVVDAYKAAQSQMQQIYDSQKGLVAQQTGDLKAEIKRLQRSEQMLRQRETELQGRIKAHEDEFEKLNTALREETDHRYEAEKKLRELEVTLRATLQDSDELLKKQTDALKQEVEHAKQKEVGLITELKLAEATVKNRDTALDTLNKEQHNIAERLKEAKQKLADAEQTYQTKLNKSRGEIKAVSQTNGRLINELSGMVHDSLEPVVETAEQLEKSNNLSEAQRHQIADAGRNCRGLIDSLNYRAELNLLSHGDSRINEDHLDLHSLLNEIDQQYTARAEAQKLFFALSFAQYQASNNVPKHVVTDKEKMRKILMILLGYALKKTRKGRMGLHVTRTSSDSENFSIVFELAYTPEEVNDELLDGIFAKESEGAVDIKHGLTLARKYISMLGGSCSTEQRDAGISAITLTFPFKRAKSEIIIPNGDENSKAGAA